MTIRQHETVAVGPGGIGRVVAEVVIPQYFGDIRHAHGCPRVATIGLLDGIHTERADSIGKITAGLHRSDTPEDRKKGALFSRTNAGQ